MIEHLASPSEPPQIFALHVIETLAPAGAEQALVNTLPAMRDAGATCEVAALWLPYDLAAPLREVGITVHELNIPSIWSVFRGVEALRGLIARQFYPANSVTQKIRRRRSAGWTNQRVDACIAVSADVANPREKTEIIEWVSH